MLLLLLFLEFSSNRRLDALSDPSSSIPALHFSWFSYRPKAFATNAISSLLASISIAAVFVYNCNGLSSKWERPCIFLGSMAPSG